MAETGHTYTDFNIPFSLGDALVLTLTATRTPSGGSVSPLDFTGGVVHVVGTQAGAATPLFHLTSSSGGVALDVPPSLGTGTATVPGTALSGLSPTRNIRVKCYFVDAGGQQHTFLTGLLTPNA